MKPREFVREKTDNDATEGIQDRFQEFCKVVSECPLIDGLMVSGIEVSDGVSVEVDHGLDRQPEGYILVDSDGDATVLERTGWDSRTITFLPQTIATNDAIIAIWVF